MTRTPEAAGGPRTARRALRQHVAAYGVVVIISSGLFAAGMLGAPLVAILLTGLLLLCPLLMWVPFRFEKKTREELMSRPRHG